MASQPNGKSVTVQLGVDDVFIWVGANADGRLDSTTLELAVALQKALQADLSAEQRVERIQRILIDPSEAMTAMDLCIRVAC